MTMSIRALIRALQGLYEQEDNALPEFPIVIRLDLGPEQEFRIVGVSLEDPSVYDPGRDPYAVIEAGSILFGDDPWIDPEGSEQLGEARRDQ